MQPIMAFAFDLAGDVAGHEPVIISLVLLAGLVLTAGVGYLLFTAGKKLIEAVFGGE